MSLSEPLAVRPSKSFQTAREGVLWGLRSVVEALAESLVYLVVGS